MKSRSSKSGKSSKSQEESQKKKAVLQLRSARLQIEASKINLLSNNLQALGNGIQVIGNIIGTIGSLYGRISSFYNIEASRIQACLALCNLQQSTQEGSREYCGEGAQQGQESEMQQYLEQLQFQTRKLEEELKEVERLLGNMQPYNG